MFKGAGWETDEILAEMMVTDDFYCERLGVVQLDAWSEGRVVLVGDAAGGRRRTMFGSTRGGR